jgi:hypothetical protein
LDFSRGIALGLLLAPLACGNVQGDSDDDRCGEIGRTRLTSTAADDKGYPASDAIDAMLAGRDGTGQPVWLTGPPELWAEQGVEVPPDRSGLARLNVEVTRIEEVRYSGDPESGWNDLCESERLEISLQANLALEDVEASLLGRARLVVSKGQPPEQLVASLSVDGWDPNDCHLVTGGGNVVTCGFTPVHATTRCLGAAELSGIELLGPEPEALLAEANDASPRRLACQGASAELEFELHAPARFCPIGTGTTQAAPALATLESVELGIPATQVPTLISECSGGYPPCGGLSLFVPLRTRDDAMTVYFALSRDDAGSTSVAIDVVGRTEPLYWGDYIAPHADGLPNCSTD